MIIPSGAGDAADDKSDVDSLISNIDHTADMEIEESSSEDDSRPTCSGHRPDFQGGDSPDGTLPVEVAAPASELYMSSGLTRRQRRRAKDIFKIRRRALTS